MDFFKEKLLKHDVTGSIVIYAFGLWIQIYIVTEICDVFAF